MKDNNIYLLASYLARPVDPTKTKIAGYMQNSANITYDEQVVVTKGLRKKDNENNVILNLTGEKIVKNSFKTDANFTEIFKHYYDSYGDYINDSVEKLNNANK